MGLCHHPELFGAFGQCHIQAPFSPACTLQKELKREGGFASPRIALDEEQVIAGVTTGHDAVQAKYSGLTLPVGGGRHLLVAKDVSHELPIESSSRVRWWRCGVQGEPQLYR